MSWTKRQIILQAFEELGLADYVYNLAPEQLQSALHRLDMMVSGWYANNVKIGYPLTSSPDNADITLDSGVPDYAVEALVSNLAVRLAPSYGKTVSPETKVLADGSYNNLLNQCSSPIPSRQGPREMPLGAGNKPWRRTLSPFVRPPEDKTLTDPEQDIIFLS